MAYVVGGREGDISPFEDANGEPVSVKLNSSGQVPITGGSVASEIQIGDGTTPTQMLAVSAIGAATVGGPVAAGAVPTGKPLDVAWDGTDTRRLLTDANGVLMMTDGGRATANVPTGAGNTVVKAGATRLCRVLVTAAGTGTGNVTFYDNATTNAGTVLALIPATVAIGTTYDVQMPAANGVVATNVLSGPQLTVSTL